MIRLKELHVESKGRVLCRVPAFEVAARERVGLVGPNASGKSTLLTVLAGLRPASRGISEVTVPMPERVYVHQRPYLFRGTVLANAAYGPRARGWPRARAQQSARGWLERLGVGELANRRVDNLSGGERRRVAVARALAVGPRLLLLDEPLADLDDTGAALVLSVLAALDDVTVVVASPTELPPGLVGRTHHLAAPGSPEIRV